MTLAGELNDALRRLESEANRRREDSQRDCESRFRDPAAGQERARTAGRGVRVGGCPP